MARYIDAEELRQKFIEMVRVIGREMSVNFIIDTIDKTPAANVVEIPCRCEQCKYTEIFTCPITGTETLFSRYGEKPVAVEPTHYCGYGEGAVNHESSKMTE